MDPIHLFVPTFRIEECLARIGDCLEAGWTGLGVETQGNSTVAALGLASLKCTELDMHPRLAYQEVQRMREALCDMVERHGASRRTGGAAGHAEAAR